MNKVKNKNRNNIVALVITIILLLILAGISIATLTGSGLFEKARLAEQESKNAQEKEEATLADYENAIYNATRNSKGMNINLCSPKLLVTASLPNTESQTRPAGNYKATNSVYTKENTKDTEKYLSYDQNTGWKIKKSGLYLITESAFHLAQKEIGNYFVNMYVNGNLRVLDRGYIGLSDSGQSNKYWSTIGSITIYLEENDIIDFEIVLPYEGKWSSADFKIEAMFE